MLSARQTQTTADKIADLLDNNGQCWICKVTGQHFRDLIDIFDGNLTISNCGGIEQRFQFPDGSAIISWGLGHAWGMGYRNSPCCCIQEVGHDLDCEAKE